uniref:Tyrosine-type recombinase/integrase n=1 Tax=Candidatus Desulfatibia profunda TaxID=2841695 RepID=A0A8J6NWL7_9BACT|nr:tyrosine-type recombinase/integrase [Candidatus Desulfatibia profunda]
MKRFESFMAQKLEEYVTYRKNLGYAKEALRPSLSTFDGYLKERNADWNAMQPSFFLQLRANIQKHPNTVNRTLSAIRGFFNFLIRQGIYAYNPLQDIPPLPEKYFIPFVFSPEETEQLLQAISNRLRKTKKDFLTDVSMYLATLLVARCGMRISEPVRLLLTHYRVDDGTIYIEKTKFRKDRLIPMPISVMAEIENYLSVRKSLMPHDENPYLLAGKGQKGLSDRQVRALFHQRVKDIGLARSKQNIGNVTFGHPTPHSLRHAFAINTLKRIKDRGESTQHALPVLAAYMGHRKYQYTHAYLKVSDAKHVAGLIAFSKSQLDVI